MNRVKILFIIIFFLVLAGHISGIPMLQLTSHQEKKLQVGETFILDVNLADNEGAYGVYFDLRYNNSVFEIESVIPGGLLPEVEDKQELLVARGPYNSAGRVIVSNSLVGDRPLFFQSGTVISFVFKAIRAGEDESIYLEQSNCGLVGKDMAPQEIETGNWDGLDVLGLYTHYFVQILSPYNNYRSNTSKPDYHIQGTINNPGAADRFTIGLKRVVDYDLGAPLFPGTEEIIKPLNSGQAYFQAEDENMFHLAPGYNYVVAGLYVNDKLKSSCLKRIYYEKKNHGVKIIRPVNNSITGKSVITIEGESTFSEVSINNMNIKVNRINNEKFCFLYERQKLKEGFNKIIARTINPDAPEIIYKDVIIVYYQRDESVFDFIEPKEDDVYKSSIINVKGVIDTIDKDLVYVKMRAEFKPFGHNDDFRYVFNDTDHPGTRITLRDLENSENFLLSQYVFETRFDLSLLEGYGSGILSFYAVKRDKTGKNSDTQVKRSVYISRERLNIDLKQPNLYSEEILNLKDLMEKYYNPPGYNPGDHSLDVDESGKIILGKQDDTAAFEDITLSGKSIKETVLYSNGSYHAIINSIPNRIELYRKNPNARYFNEQSKRTYFNAFANCGVEFGNNSLLLGISDYNTGVHHPSGLILNNNGLLRTAKLPYEINHVQYINRAGDDYYLYSSNSKYMYKFKESDVVINQYDDAYFEINNIQKYYLPNNHFINGFEVSADGGTIVLATDVGLKIYEYNTYGNVYSLASVLKTGQNITRLSKSELKSGYIVYLFGYEDESRPGIMKIGTLTETSGNYFIEKDCNVPCGYMDVFDMGPIVNNKFYLYGLDESGDLSFQEVEVFYGGFVTENFSLPVSSLAADKPGLLFFDERNYHFYGKGFSTVTDVYSGKDGIMELLIADNNVDGIVGFSYWAPGKYENLLEVGYLLTDDPDETEYIEFNGGGNPAVKPGMSLYEYSSRQKSKYLKLRIKLKSGQDSLFSGYIENLTIKKQEKVKITGGNLPVRGFILDKTLGPDDFTINSKVICPEDNGSFYDILKLDPDGSANEKEVRLFAANSSGETDEIIFNIISVYNEPQLTGITFDHPGGVSLPVITYELEDDSDYIPLETNAETISLKGQFSGLYGVQVNCELYSIDSQNNISGFIESYNSNLINPVDESGVISGAFEINNILLLPGVQRIILRSMNPAGARREVKFDVNFNVVDQKVEILNHEITGNRIADRFTVQKNMDNEYIKSFELMGRVITSNPVDHINFRSDNDYISFSKGDIKDVDYIKVELNSPGKMFSVYVNLKMYDYDEELLEYFKMWPDSLQLSELSQNIYVDFVKVYKNVTPDFSISDLNSETGMINLRFGFDEPVPNNMLMRLRLNHEEIGNFPVYLPVRPESSNDYFNYSDGDYSYKQPLCASHGFNILEWWFYEDRKEYGLYESGRDKLLAGSGNSNFISFNYDSGEEYIPLSVNFPAQDIYYDDTSLGAEPLVINFDNRGILTVKINEQLLKPGDYTTGNIFCVDLTTLENCLSEGANIITVNYVMEAKNIDQSEKCRFNYDSVFPLVNITSVDSLNDFVNPCVQSVTCDVMEDNLKRVNLIYDDSVVNVKADITILDRNKYIYSWKNLEDLKIIPGKNKALYVEVLDITGKAGISKEIDQGQWRYYDVELSNSIENTNVDGYGGLEINGTNDIHTDYSSYWNETDNSFPVHLKYQSTDLKDEEGPGSREDITGNFNKDTVFNSGKKYLMLEFENEADLQNVDLGYRRKNEITKKAALAPVDMLIHKGITKASEITNSLDLGLTDEDGSRVLSLVEGYKTYESQYIGFAHDILIYENYIFVHESVDQDRDGQADYQAVVIYDLLKEAAGSMDKVLGFPKIIDVIDYEFMQNITKMKIYDNYLYLLCGNDGIAVYDINPLSDPLLPDAAYVNTIKPVNDDERNCYVYDIEKNENFLYVATGDDGIKTFHITDLSSPYEMTSVFKHDFIPVSLGIDGPALYGLSKTGHLMKLDIVISEQTSNLSFWNSIVLEQLPGDDGKLIVEDNIIKVFAEQNSFMYSYSADDLSPVSQSDIKCNDISLTGSLGTVYSSNDGLIIFKDNKYQTMVSGACYGIVSYKNFIYSAHGKHGIKIIGADGITTYELEDIDNNDYPDGWRPSPNSAVINLNNDIADLPFEISGNTKSGIIKDIENRPVDPSSSIVVNFNLNSINNSSLFTVKLGMAGSGVLSKSFVIDTDSMVDFSIIKGFETFDHDEIVGKTINFSDVGLAAADQLVRIELVSDMFWAYGSSPSRRTGITLVDSVSIPEFRSFSLPLNHAAYKIKKNIGDMGKVDLSLELIKPEMFVKTETGKILVYFPINNMNRNDIVERAFLERSGEEITGEELIEVDYPVEGFTVEGYRTGQCVDDQEDPVYGKLTKLNEYNAERFDTAFLKYKARREEEDLSIITLGESTEDLVLINAPENYKIYLTDTLVVTPSTSGEAVDEKSNKIIQLPRRENGAISFWLRLEDEIPDFINKYTGRFRGDYSSTFAKPVVSWGGQDYTTPAGYADATYRFVVLPEHIGFAQYKKSPAINKYDDDIESDNIILGSINTFGQFESNDYGRWLLVTLSWDHTGGLTFFINNRQINVTPRHFNDFDFEKFLEEKIVFGDVGQDVDSLFYSIANPKIFNRTLGLKDVTALYLAYNRLNGNGTGLSVYFNNDLNIFYNNYSYFGGEDVDDVVSTSDPVYEESMNGKAFVVTSGIKNYIPGDFESEYLRLSGDLVYDDLIRYNAGASYENTTGVLSLTAGGDDDYGIYHLTDGGSSGLGIPGHDSYTFFGTLLPGPFNENDVCVIKINGVEKEYKLEPGDYQFTFDGAGNVLNSIDIYFRFKQGLNFDADRFGFNTGRYPGNNLSGYPANHLHLKHRFHHKESVIIYYEGLYDNEWELNGEEIVILESRLYKIGIKDNKYYCLLKTASEEIRLDSDKEITEGLHQFALIYDFSSLRYRFYIDARLEAEYGGPVFTMPLVVGVFPEVYNISIGGTLDDTIKGEGLIDEFTILPEIIGEKELQDQYYYKSRMISVKEEPLFNSSTVNLTLKNLTDNEVTLTYNFNDSPEMNTVQIGGSNQSQEDNILYITGEFSLGHHELVMNIDNGRFSKQEVYKFVVSYAPVVTLTDYKSIIIKEENKNIEFKLNRDINTLFAEKNEFIELKLFLKGGTVDGIDDHEVQTITEDRKYSNFGKYYRDMNYSTLSDEIKFVYPFSGYRQYGKIYYKIMVYYFNDPSNVFELEGYIKILDIEEPGIIKDAVTGRPLTVSTGIVDFDEQRDTVKDIRCGYEIKYLDDSTQEYSTLARDILPFNDMGMVSVYVYEYAAAGNYRVIFRAIDGEGNVGSTREIEYHQETGEENGNDLEHQSGEAYISDFDLILVDEHTNTAQFSINGGVYSLNEDDVYSLIINSGEEVLARFDYSGSGSFNELITLENLVVGMEFLLNAVVEYDGSAVSKEIRYRYNGLDVDIKLTHGAAGYISYNNVYFNWEGYLDGKTDSRLGYRYSIDNSPWGMPSENNGVVNNHVEFYNLDDGFHKFKVQTYFGDNEQRVYSPVASNVFIIDSQKPVIHEEKIAVTEVFDDYGVISHLEVSGEADSVYDLTLSDFLINGQPVPLDRDMGFLLENIPLDTDGKNEIKLSAYDVLGNQTDVVKDYNFKVLAINYPPTIENLSGPGEDEFVKYSPLTVYGKITDNVIVDDGVKVFVEDPYGKREAVINFDRTFFVENVKINPGNKFKAIRTELKFITEFPNGKRLTKVYPVYAKDVIKPIELDLSVHAVAGGADTTNVRMNGLSRIDNIASWSFDYDGDGIYEDEYFTNTKEITVYYNYSNVGMIHPRVRIITTDDHIFSGDDTLIIHDKIIKADIKDVDGVRSLDIIEIDDETGDQVDGFEFVYVLQKENGNFIIKRYIIEANKAVLVDNSSIKINLNELNINYPRSIKVDNNGDIYVSSLYGGGSKLFKLARTSGGYIKEENFDITLGNEVISSFDIDEKSVYISLEDSSDLLKYTKTSSFIKRSTPDMDSIIQDCQSDYGVEVDKDRVWLGDYKNQRVVCISGETFKLRDFFGEAGNGEGEFISPRIVRVKGNFIFVLDQSEYTLQVFESVDEGYRIICRVDNLNDYLPGGFMNHIADFTTFSKIENTRNYYYMALANNEYKQVALLRIPQWEANSVKVKSNLVVYTKNNEIFTSKPDGADARKIFSSGSLPGVDGNVDYPSIGPDGTIITFVSKIERFEYSVESGDFVFKKYDKLYLMNVDGTGCKLVNSELIRDKEIERPQFSYNGSTIVFSAKGAGEYWAIYEYDKKSGEVVKLFNPGRDCMRPTYSPDDRYIAYVTKYFSHTEIVIYDSENPDLIISLTNNDYSDDYPVWAPVYEGETMEKDIKSKIAFISKPDFTERVFYTYIAQASSGDFRIVKANGDDIGSAPDDARNGFENLDYNELGIIGYPCFTADGKTVIFEACKDGQIRLMKYNMENKAVGGTGIPVGSTRPSGMKNRIVNFEVETTGGNDLALTWDRYAKEDLIYTVAYKSSESDAHWVEKSFTSQDHALIEDLKMGLTYHVRVYIKDLLRGDEVTTSVLKKVVIYPVIAKPIITVDENNPYLVKMKAWKPETDTPWEYQWKFKWFIDNYEVKETFSDVVEYEFGAAGNKRIVLEACLDTNAAKMHRSGDYIIRIKGDLKPVIVYELVEESGSVSVKLDASKSTGSKIDRNNYKWKLSGSNLNTNLPPEEFSGTTVIRNLDAYKGNIYITLTAMSLPVMGQVETIREEQSQVIMIPLGLREIKPVITENASAGDPTLFTFDGSRSIGNIEWTSSTWEVFGPDNLYFQGQGKSHFSYNFPETNENTDYTVVLNAMSKATGATASTSKIITVGKVPVIPVIDFKVITADQYGETVTAKLLLSAASSKGSDIDWNTVKWNVPLAGDYGGSSSQTGATAVYNLYNIKKGMTIDVNLTIRRKSSGDIMEVSELITLNNNEVPEIEPFIELVKEDYFDLYETAGGDVYVFSALNSKGANIDWNSVSWLIDGQYTRQGSVVRYDAADSGESNQAVVVTLTLNSTGGGAPVSKTVSFDLKRKKIDVVITKKTGTAYVEADEKNIVRLSVKDSTGRNIDWERTRWFIYQGPEDVVEKYGAEIIHTFPLSAAPIDYYPVSVQMFFKGSNIPFVRQTNVRVKGDELKAIIKEEYDRDLKEEDKYARTFSAADSSGENIDWQSCKWSFGDSSEYQYGPVVTHKFPVDDVDASYLVSLTIQRKTKAGKTEISTDIYVMNIGKDEVKARITVAREGNYVVFSAEESEGRGLMLDRSVWMFEGSDSENSGESETDIDYEHKTVITGGYSKGWTVDVTDSTIPPSAKSYVLSTGGITITTGTVKQITKLSKKHYNTNSSTSETYLQDGSINQSSGESSQNIYTGAACRKVIDGSWNSKMITLIVYRALPDGSMDVQTKTFKYVPGFNDNVTIE